jgi:hypothetical protein
MRRAAALLALLAAACRYGGGSDGGVFDSAIFDAEPREAGAGDARPDGSVVLDVGAEDGGELDGAIRDGGERTCEAPIAWPDPKIPIVDTTAGADHRERFSCSGVGAGAVAPEGWVAVKLEAPTHAIFRLGTDGWDGVLSARTATCADAAEVACADEPSIVELTGAVGLVYLGVEGFARGAGPFAISAFLGDALSTPPVNTICGSSPDVTLPLRAFAHNFGATSSIAACDLASAVYFPMEVSSADLLSARIEPLSEGDVGLAVLDGCGAVIACAASGGDGVSEVIDGLAVSPGRYAIVAGSAAGTREQSFELMSRAGARCVRDADCALGARCGPNLECGPIGSGVTVAGPIPIPDDGEVSVPILVSIPIERPTIRIRVAVEHPLPADLVVDLVAPGGRPIVRLRDRLDGALDSVYGRDRPADGPGSLDDFRMVSTASGTWTLRVRDRALGDEGSVEGVVLEVE